MNLYEKLKLSSLILNKAKEYGADKVGIASVDELKTSPSHEQAPKMPRLEIGKRERNLEPLEVAWPKDGKSVVVHAVSHPEDEPELDWWYGKASPPGNQKLMEINDNLAKWIKENFQDVNTYKLPYSVEKGGIFLKDAAVMSGLGCIGQNNLLITPEYGPRVRLRAIIISERLFSSGPITFNPCSYCEKYCLKQCPQEAFNKRGDYKRFICNVEMEQNEKDYLGQSYKKAQPLKYCRNCELSCPIGEF